MLSTRVLLMCGLLLIVGLGHSYATPTIQHYGHVQIDNDITGDGTLSISADEDIAVELGRWKMGFSTGGADWALFGHYDHFDTTSFAIGQDNGGDTYINADTGDFIYFGVGGVAGLMARMWVNGTQDRFSFSNTQLGLGGSWGSDRVLITCDDGSQAVTINSAGPDCAVPWDPVPGLFHSSFCP